MGEATGTVGAGPPVSDTEIASHGGVKFLARLTQIAEARDAHDAARQASVDALADLNLGKSAVEAHKGAATDRAEASKALEAAQRAAAQTISDAEARAAALMRKATQDALQTRGEATKVLDAAKAEADSLRAAATEHHSVAEATRAEVAALKDELGRTRESMAAAIASAVAKEQQAEAALADLMRRHDIMTEAMQRAAPRRQGGTMAANGTNTFPGNSAVTIVPRGYISGLGMAPTNGGNTMSIAAGMAATSDGLFLLSSTSFVKGVFGGGGANVPWAQGSGHGGLDTGMIANSTWYWFFEIFNSSLNAFDFIYSLAVAGQAPAIAAPPVGWTSSRYIGSWPTDSGGSWASVVQTGDDFTWSPAPTTPDINGVMLGTVAGIGNRYTLSVPLGVKVKAKTRSYTNNATNGSQVLIYSPEEGDPSANSPIGNYNLGTGIANVSFSGEINTITDTSGRIGAIGATAGNVLYLNTIGWNDPRGKNS